MDKPKDKSWLNAAPKRETVRHYVSINSAINTLLILWILWTMRASHAPQVGELAEVVGKFPIAVQWIIDNAAPLAAAATALGGVWAAFQKRAHDERKSDE